MKPPNTWFSIIRRLCRAALAAPVALLFAIPAAPDLRAQMVPDAPVRNFRLPMFGEEGFRIWELRGAEGRYIDENRVDVVNMTLKVFSQLDPSKVETEILSPKATMLVRQNKAEGDESITMTGDHYIIQGRKWQWDGNEHRVVIDDQVKVIFFEGLRGLLK